MHSQFLLLEWTGSVFGQEVPLTEPDSAIGGGYGESKWVSECILHTIASKSALRVTAIRCGQMTGGQSGAWNEHEWFPSIVKSSFALDMFPAGEGVSLFRRFFGSIVTMFPQDISWISAHEAGGAIVNMLDAHEDVFHVVHPKPVPWDDLAIEFSKALNVPLVPYKEWLETLERKLVETGTDAAEVEKAFSEVPALRLMDFFRAAKMSSDREPIGITRLASEKAQAASQVLREAEKVGTRDVERWIAFWRRTGFLPA